MKTRTFSKRLAVALVIAGVATTAQAGGPLYLADPDTPYAWDVTTPVPVFTDMGDLCDSDPSWPFSGCLSNEQADAAVAFSFGQWSAVPSSSFQATVAGDFESIGLGDVTGETAGNVVGTFNGGGYHVMYDSDSSIIQDFFGAPPNVLGISSPEWAEGSTITESWAVINVAAVPEGDDGAQAAGVMTHEFGHGINLAHSQANGHITFFGAPWFWISWAPKSCSAPYDVSVIEDWFEYQAWIRNTAIPNTETMYPYITPNATGAAMSVVNRPDDIAAVSNLYPGAGWPQSHGSISGRILLKDGSTELTGVNVVARNVADPLGDVVTVMSGDMTQGTIGPDGRYTINGLTPGAEYIVYVESIVSGGFPTPPAVLPSFQEYWNGAGESADASTDDPCAWSTIRASAGSRTTADIAFNGIAGAPKFVQIPVSSATDVDNSGRHVVGTYAGEIGWRFDTKTGDFDLVASNSVPKLSRDGHTMTASLPPEIPTWEGGMNQPGLWSPNSGWQFLSMPGGEPGCDGTIMSPYAIDGTGQKVVGLAYKNGCPHGDWHPDGLNQFYAGLWAPKTGLTYLETPEVVFEDMPNCTWNRDKGCPVNGSRANAISANGNTIVGHLDAVGWKGAAWINGKLTLMGADDPKGWIGSANAVNRDGNAVVGGEAGSNEWGAGIDAYLWSPTKGTRNLGHFSVPCEEIAPWDCPWTPTIDFPAIAFAVTDDGGMVVGRAGDFWNGFIGFLWMEETGMLDLNEFLQGQGIMEAFTSGIISPLAISGDGKTIVGWGLNDNSQISYAITLDQVFVCDKEQTFLVGFPGAMKAKLAKGATLGMCEADRPIAP